MNANESEIRGYRFENYQLDVRNRELRRDGERLALNSKYFDVLHLLVRHQNQLVEKQKIFEEVWEGVIVTDAALTQCVKDIRKILQDEVARPRFIKTVPKHGYVFIGQAFPLNGSEIAPRAAEAAATAAHTGYALSRPYKFLDYYTEHDAALFFGREAEIATITSQILTHRSFILHGRSGVGKSSLLRAGLLPALKAHGHEVFVLRGFTPPVEQMRTLLQCAVTTSTVDTSLTALLRQLAERVPERGVIFLLDQCEELFTLLDDVSRRQFLSALAEIYAQENLPVRFVFAVREDLLAEMSQFKSALPEIFHHEYRLKRLSREQAARAIVEPAKAAGCEWENQLVTRVLADLSDGESVDPPQLQIVCDRLYDARDKAQRVTLALYEKLGTAAQILAGYLERVLQRFNAADLNLAKEILTTMISAEHQRLVLRVEELILQVNARARGDSADLNRLLEELATARIMRYRNHEGEGWIELAHDFLVPEISRWLTSEAYALKRARGIIERAMENFRAHQLLLDAEALQLLLPFGPQLGLRGEEADLLLKSVLHRGPEAPAWLAQLAPSAEALILEASRSNESATRLRVIAACLLAPTQATQRLLRELALWEKEPAVRRSASLALAKVLGSATENILTLPAAGEKLSLLRQSMSLAFIRDHDKKLVRLAHHAFILRTLILAQLVWLRLHRHGPELLRQGLGGMLGAAVAGVLGGFMLGSSLAWIRHTTILQGTSIIVVLVSLGVFVSAFGGMAVSFGMLAVHRVTNRHSRWWSVLGAAAGGAFIGGIANSLGTDMFRALFGRELVGITGAYEGAVIGAGLAFGLCLMESVKSQTRAWHRILAAALGAMGAGIALTLIGGNLFTGSLAIVTHSFSNSELRIDSLAARFGEVPLGRTMLMIISAIEAFLFGATMSAGMEIAKRSDTTKAL